jgi:hypothetical protein
MEFENEVVQLNSYIGYYLLQLLDGTDATNFLEVADKSNQFGSIVPVSDHAFIKLMKTFDNNHRIDIPREMYEKYLHECEVIDSRLVPFNRIILSSRQPKQRLFMHPCFSIEGFKKLRKTYQTPFFQCYSRLLSFNTDFDSSDYGLIDYELYGRTLGSSRDLNDHEIKFFKRK